MKDGLAFLLSASFFANHPLIFKFRKYHQIIIEYFKEDTFDE